MTAAIAMSPAQNSSDPLPMTARSTAERVSRGTATLPALQARPTSTPTIRPRRWRRSTDHSNRHPARVEAAGVDTAFDSTRHVPDAPGQSVPARSFSL